MMIQECIIKFGKDVNTDQIIPSQYLLLPTIEEMKQYTFEPLRPSFVEEVKERKVIIAGENFGCGSSREQAPRVLKALGVKAIVAQSYARIFYRNAINIGLPVVVCKDIYEVITEDDEIAIDMIQGSLQIVGKDEIYHSTKLPEYIMKIIEAGGLINMINNR